MNDYYSDFYSDYPSSADTSVGVGIILVFLLILLAVSALPLIMYIIRSIALYRLADRRGVGSPICAWIPIASEYLLGQLTDEVDARRTGHNKKWAKSVIITTVIGGGGFALAYVFIFAFALSIGIAETNYHSFPTALVVAMIVFYFLFVAAMMMLYASYILRFICNFKLFEDVKPEKAVLYTILSVAVPLAEPILLFKIKELGYEKPAPEFMYPFSAPQFTYQPSAAQYPGQQNYQAQQQMYQQQMQQQQMQQQQMQQQQMQQQQMQGQFPPEPPQGI